MTKVRWAVLGTSFISDEACKAIQASSTGELVAIGNHSNNRIAKFQAQYPDIKIYAPIDATDTTSLQRLMDDSDIDAVYIGSPNVVHKELILQCLAAGKHVLCEKPFVLTSEEMIEVSQACQQKSSLVCMEALMNLYHPFTQWFKQIISEEIGAIETFEARYTCNIEPFANRVLGGAIRNLGCYPVSLVRFILGCEPTEVIAQPGEIGTDNNIRKATLALTFPHNITATIFAADDEPKNSDDAASFFKITGKEGEIEVLTNPWLPGKENQIICRKKNGESKTLNFNAQKLLYSYEIDAVGEAIIARNSPQSSRAYLHTLPVSLEFSAGNVSVLEVWEKNTRACHRQSPSYGK